MPIADLSDELFRALLKEMQDDPQGHHPTDVVAVLRRLGFDKKTYRGHDYYIRSSYSPIYLPDSWTVVSVELAQYVARIALEILGAPKP